MSRVKTDREFWDSASMNNRTYLQYYNRLIELAVSRFEWINVPDTIDVRFMELALLADGKAVFFYDDALGYLSLRVAIGGRLDVYRIPIERRAYANNGYQMKLDNTNSVIIFNNYLHTGCMNDIDMYARRLYNLERAIDVNANAQKTPILIQCDENQRLTLKNVYMKYDGNQPVIMGDKNLNPNSIKVLQTGAPYVADRLYQLKTEIWNEALTYLGIPNINVNKKERLITDEVERYQGGTIASRFSALETRKDACKKINAMFGLNIDVQYRDADVEMDSEYTDEKEVNDNE